MKIFTIITKKSVREPEKNKKFLKFFSDKNFMVGNMFEIIDGNKKGNAILLKISDVSEFKEQIRSGGVEIKKLKFSKTGLNSNGKVFDKFSIAEIKKFIKNPEQAKLSPNKNISTFFPRKNKKYSPSQAKDNLSKKGSSSIGELMSNKILFRKKTYTNPMQERVDTIRKYFQDNSRYGFGSFSYYIGMFKQVPDREIDQIFAETKQLKKNIFEKKKIFWYRIGKSIKEKK